MRHSERIPTNEDDIYEGRYHCVECKTGQQLGTYAHIPANAFPLYDGHKGQKFCCKEHWGVMIRKLVRLVSPLPLRKRGRLEFGASKSVPIARTLCVSSILAGGASNDEGKEGEQE